MVSELERRFISSVRMRGLLPQGSVITAAVSGGADSVAMLLLMDRFANHMNWSLSVLHVDHHARPGSGADSDFVKRLSSRLGLPFILTDIHPEESGSTEGEFSSARAAIYKETGHNGTLVAVGHTADDRAETLLIRLLESSGLRGLGGMGFAGEGPVRRPILDLARAELRKWLGSIGQEWVEDPTNDSGAYLRNRIRMTVLPALEEVLPGGVMGLAGAAENLSMWRDAADWLLEKTLAESFPGNVCSLEEYRGLPRAVRLGTLWSLCGRPRGGRTELDKADRWLIRGNTGSHPLAGGFQAISGRGSFKVVRTGPTRTRNRED